MEPITTDIEYNEFGIQFHLEQEYEKAIICFTDSLRICDDDSVFFYNRGLSKLCLHLYEEALYDFDAASNLSPEIDIYISKRAWCYYTLSRYQLSMNDFKKVLTIDKNNHAAMYGESLCLIKLGFNQEAINNLTHAIQIDPCVIYYGLRAETYEQLHKYNEAITDYKKCIQLEPSNEEYYANKGMNYYWLENYELADIDYSRAISLNPSNSVYYGYRGICRYNSEKFIEAIEDFNIIINKYPQKKLYYGYRAECYFNLKLYKKALADFNIAITNCKEDVVYLIDRSKIYCMMGKLEQAIVDQTKIISICPLQSETYATRGIIRYNIGDYKGGIRDLYLSLKYNPCLFQHWGTIGLINYLSGNTEEGWIDMRYATHHKSCIENVYTQCCYVELRNGNYVLASKYLIKGYTICTHLQEIELASLIWNLIAKKNISIKKTLQKLSHLSHSTGHELIIAALALAKKDRLRFYPIIKKIFELLEFSFPQSIPVSQYKKQMNDTFLIKI